MNESVFVVLALCFVMSPQPWDVFRGSGGEWTAVSRHPRVDVKGLRQGNVFVYEYRLRPGQCVYWCYEVYLCFAVLKVFLTGTNYSVFVQACMYGIVFKTDVWTGGSIISQFELQLSLFVQKNFERVVEFCLFFSLKVFLWHVILSFIGPEVRLLILQNMNKPHNINKRTDLASICIHKHKHFLASVI